MQLIDGNQTVFSLSLGAALVLGTIFSMLVRWASKKKWIGQTAWAVVIGVSFTLLTMVPVFGIEAVAIMFLFFSASGIPMIIEYLVRIQKEIQDDNETAKKVASELFNDRQTGSR
jgi:predicted MFS family arabinose efflux permease